MENNRNTEKQKALINFYVDVTTKARFDGICRASGKTRTQVLVALMEDHIIRSKTILEARLAKLKEADGILSAIDNYEDEVQSRIDEEEFEMPPAIFWSDEGWNQVPDF